MLLILGRSQRLLFGSASCFDLRQLGLPLRVGRCIDSESLGKRPKFGDGNASNIRNVGVKVLLVAENLLDFHPSAHFQATATVGHIADCEGQVSSDFVKRYNPMLFVILRKAFEHPSFLLAQACNLNFHFLAPKIHGQCESPGVESSSVPEL